MKTEIIDYPDPENDSETCCKSCGDEYELRDGCEPTKYCDLCAQKVVERIERELDKATAELEMWRDGNIVREEDRAMMDAARTELSRLRDVVCPEDVKSIDAVLLEMSGASAEPSNEKAER